MDYVTLVPVGGFQSSGFEVSRIRSLAPKSQGPGAPTPLPGTNGLRLEGGVGSFPHIWQRTRNGWALPDNQTVHFA